MDHPAISNSILPLSHVTVGSAMLDVASCLAPIATALALLVAMACVASGWSKAFVIPGSQGPSEMTVPTSSTLGSVA
jgi:hypothetical protein